MASVSEPTAPVSFQQDQVKVNNAATGSFTIASLYVGDLDSSVTETQLRDFFAQAVEGVKSVKVCRDHITNASRGYGYVNYSNLQDATKAMDLLNFKPINGKPVRIMLSNRDTNSRKSGANNVFIKNFDSSVDSAFLHEVFSVFGTILSCKVATDSNGCSKGYGYIQFDQEEAAQNAIKVMNRMVLNCSQIYVSPFICKEERDRAKRSQRRHPTLKVKNLWEPLYDGILEILFGRYGRVADAVIVRDKTGDSRGFGYVVYEDKDAAATAIEKLDRHNHEGKVWSVGWAQTKSERPAELKSKFEEGNTKFEKLQGANLYLKNLDDSVNDEKLRELFSEFGTITSCKVMLDSQGQSKGYGFVAFSSPGDASKAVNEMNGKMIGRKPLYVAVAQRKEERKARLQAYFTQVRAPVTTAPVPLGTYYTQVRAPVTAPVPLGMHMFHPVGPRLGPQQQICFGQEYGFQQQVLPGVAPEPRPAWTSVSGSSPYALKKKVGYPMDFLQLAASGSVVAQVH